MSSDVEYLSHILTGLISSPDQLNIDRTTDEMGVLLTVHIAKSDMGKVIGKGGHTINSVRHIMKCYGFGVDAELNVKVAEPA